MQRVGADLLGHFHRAFGPGFGTFGVVDVVIDRALLSWRKHVLTGLGFGNLKEGFCQLFRDMGAFGSGSTAMLAETGDP